MNKVLLNTLYVGTEGAYLRLENDQVRVEVDGQKLAQVPIHHLGSLVLFGQVGISTGLITRCAEDGRSVALMSEHGRFRARVQGRMLGNVLLRKAQYDFHSDAEKSLHFARAVVAGKLQNSRQTIMRAGRDAKPRLRESFEAVSSALGELIVATEFAPTLDEARGIEGVGAQEYFSVFDSMITSQRTDFRFDHRSRRPPRDRINALMSFVYSMWTNDCVSALESVGLDPQFGILHALRPGRPSLALDLVEEFRSIFLDRLCLTLVNRRQVQSGDFVERMGGSVMLTEEGRKKVLTAYQLRKKEEIRHPFLKEKVAIGLLPYIQARLMARTFRAELAEYPPYRP